MRHGRGDDGGFPVARGACRADLVSILVVLIGVSIVVLIGAGIALFWAVDHGQFDDMETPGLLPLADRDDTAAPSSVAAEDAPHPGADAARTARSAARIPMAGDPPHAERRTP